MDISFENDDEDKMNVDIEPDCNTFEIWNDNQWNVMILTDEQVKNLKDFLNGIN